MATDLRIDIDEAPATAAFERLLAQTVKADAGLAKLNITSTAAEAMFARNATVIKQVAAGYDQYGAAAGSAGHATEVASAAIDRARKSTETFGVSAKSAADTWKALTGVVKKNDFKDIVDEVLGLNKSLDSTEKHLRGVSDAYKQMTHSAQEAKQATQGMGGLQGSHAQFSGGGGGYQWIPGRGNVFMPGTPAAGAGGGISPGMIGAAGALRAGGGMAGMLSGLARFSGYGYAAHLGHQGLVAGLEDPETLSNTWTHGRIWDPGRQDPSRGLRTQFNKRNLDRLNEGIDDGVYGNIAKTLNWGGEVMDRDRRLRAKNNQHGSEIRHGDEDDDIDAFMVKRDQRRIDQEEGNRRNSQHRDVGLAQGEIRKAGWQTENEEQRRRDRLMPLEHARKSEEDRAHELIDNKTYGEKDAFRSQQMAADFANKEVESYRNKVAWEERSEQVNRQIANEERARHKSKIDAEHENAELDKQAAAYAKDKILYAKQLQEIDEKKSINEGIRTEAARASTQALERQVQFSHQLLVDTQARVISEEQSRKIIEYNQARIAAGLVKQEEIANVAKETAAAEQKITEAYAVRRGLMSMHAQLSSQEGIRARMTYSTEGQATSEQHAGLDLALKQGATPFEQTAGKAKFSAGQSRIDELNEQRIGSITGIAEGLKDRMQDYRLKFADTSGKEAMDKYAGELRGLMHELEGEQIEADRRMTESRLLYLKKTSDAAREAARIDHANNEQKKADALAAIAAEESEAKKVIQLEAEKKRVYEDAHRDRLRQIAEVEARADKSLKTHLAGVEKIKGGIKNVLSEALGPTGDDGPASGGFGNNGGQVGGAWSGPANANCACNPGFSGGHGYGAGATHLGMGGGMSFGAVSGMSMPFMTQGFKSAWSPQLWGPNSTPPGYERANLPAWMTNGAEIQRPSNMFGGGDGVVTARGGSGAHRGGIYGGIMGGMGLGRAITGGPGMGQAITGGPLSPEQMLGYGFGQKMIDNTTMMGGGGFGLASAAKRRSPDGLSTLDQAAMEEIALSRAEKETLAEERKGEFVTRRDGSPAKDARGKPIRRKILTMEEQIKRARARTHDDWMRGKLGNDEVRSGRAAAMRGATMKLAGVKPEDMKIADPHAETRRRIQEREEFKKQRIKPPSRQQRENAEYVRGVIKDLARDGKKFDRTTGTEEDRTRKENNYRDMLQVDMYDKDKKTGVDRAAMKRSEELEAKLARELNEKTIDPNRRPGDGPRGANAKDKEILKFMQDVLQELGEESDINKKYRDKVKEMADAMQMLMGENRTARNQQVLYD